MQEKHKTIWKEARVRLEETKYVAAGKHRVVPGKILGGARPLGFAPETAQEELSG